jgi:hypothetical protein
MATIQELANTLAGIQGTGAAPSVTDEQIQNYFRNNPNTTDADIYGAMNQYGVSPDQLSSAMNFNPSLLLRYAAQQGISAPLPQATPMPMPEPMAAPVSPVAAPGISDQQIQDWFQRFPNATDAQISAAMKANNVSGSQLSSAMGYDPSRVDARYTAVNSSPNAPIIQDWFKRFPNATDAQIYAAMKANNISQTELADAMRYDPSRVAARYAAAEAAANQGTPVTPVTPPGTPVTPPGTPVTPPGTPVTPTAPNVPVAQADVPYGLTAAQAAMTSGQQQGEMAQLQGLAGGEQALTEGQRAALQNLTLTQQRTAGLYDKGIGYYEPYTQGGVGAYNQQAALSGALGPEAQQQAYAAYQQSPGVAFAQQEAERAILRNAAAVGGLGGGNVRDELSRRAVGTYMQDFQNQFGRLGEVSAQGFNAASQAAGMRGAQAGSEQALGMTAAQIPMNVGSAIAQGRFQTGQTIGGQRSQLGQVMGNQAYQAGTDIANAIANTTSSLSALTNAQGAGMSDIMSNTVNNINNLYQQAAAGDSEAISQLQATLANLGTGAGSSYSNVPIVPGVSTNLAEGVAGIGAGFTQKPAQINPVRYVTSGAGGGYGPNYNTPYQQPAFKIPGIGG